MTIRNLGGLLAPTSIAVVGPRRLHRAAVDVLLANLAASGFRGPLYGVDLDDQAEEHAIAEFATIEALPRPADLAVVVAGPTEGPALVARLGAMGTRAVTIPAPHYDEWPRSAIAATLKAARPNRVRVVGPGSLGFLVPPLGVNVSLSSAQVAAGDLALLSRSGAVMNATLTLAARRGVGFSAAIALGQKTDVDISDLVDWFAADPATRAILLHTEHVSDPRKFLSATRAAARAKPVIVVRSGSSDDPPPRDDTHASRLAGADAVYDAAFLRAGCLRVADVDEMFDAAEAVSRLRSVPGRRLAIVGNGRSLCAFAADRHLAGGGLVAELGAATRARLAGVSRPLRSGNLVVLDGDAEPERIAAAVAACLADRETDSVLAAVAPSAFAEQSAVAEALAGVAEEHRRGGGQKSVIAALAGAEAPALARLDRARVLVRAAAGMAVESFLYLVRHGETIARLTETPPSLPADFAPDVARAQATVAAEVAAGRTWLSTAAMLELFDAYGIGFVDTAVCATPAEAAVAAKAILDRGGRIVVKLGSPGTGPKHEIGAIRLGLSSPAEVETAGEAILARAAGLGIAEREGLLVQPLIERDGTIELFAGITDDAVFGPVAVVGRGGTAVETIADRSLDLVPLDRALARSLVDRTRVSRRLTPRAGGRAPEADALALVVAKLSQLVVDLPEVVDVDLNPLIAEPDRIVAVDGRVKIRPVDRPAGLLGHPRLAIRPYPKEWERPLVLRDGSALLGRPLRPEDEPALLEMMGRVTPEDLRLRFFAPLKSFSHAFLARLTQLDYARAMAFAAVDETGAILGVVRLHADPDHRTGEYAILVRSDLKGQGLGWALMELIIEYARADGLRTIAGEVLRENRTMIAMCEALGFTVRAQPEDHSIVDVTLDLAPPP